MREVTTNQGHILYMIYIYIYIYTYVICMMYDIIYIYVDSLDIYVYTIIQWNLMWIHAEDLVIKMED